ncbi:pectinesterase 31-like isoform X2 [Panicum virgatum]|uniref:pectinesterase 31-like isoform X2 n=1 Tax=Panicum virgatum TaxID=38727 RepID=UPI0019D5DD6F|nr:pectinesterase 31-like isoform X2 [Panicum virgatum]
MADRRVLVVVSPEIEAFGYDGVDSFASLQDAVPLNNQVRTINRIAPGVCTSYLFSPKASIMAIAPKTKTKSFITLRGLEIKDTGICWDNTATRIKHTQSPGMIGTATYSGATVIVEGDDFITENVIFKNSAPQVSGQEAAACVTADRDSTALLEHCHIHCKSTGYITAHGRKSSSESTGFVFFRCVITGNCEAAYMYLGRPWEPLWRVIFAETSMDYCIEPVVGWHNWDKPENEQTACFCEYSQLLLAFITGAPVQDPACRNG